MKKFLFLWMAASVVAVNLFAQKNKTATPAALRLEGFKQRQNLEKNSLLSQVKFRSIGPTIMSGRVVDIEVNPYDSSDFYVAYASGGLWHTENNGTSFSPMFDQEAVMTIGDIAIDWSAWTEKDKKTTIWVGSGENNSSRSSYSGTGVYKSTDAGKTWKNMGLPESHHIGRMVIDPNKPNTVFVAALGHLYSPNKERGLYKTSDGGETWKLVLSSDENTGAIDVAIDPKNPNVLYSSLWHRERRAWNFVEGGSTSGIYKSIDGGETWSKSSTAESGFPQGEGVGRIGLAVYPQQTNIIYAVVDNQSARKEEKTEKKDEYTKETFRKIEKEAFLSLNDEKLNAFLRENRFPEKHTAQSVKASVKAGQLQPAALVEYLEDANSQMFGTPIIEAEVYRSNDAGKTWTKANTMDLRGLFNTYGYYFAQIRVSPNNPDKVYIMGVPIWRSDDGGKNFKSIDADNVHSDHHALWVDPKKDGHLINGNDGGINISYDDGKTWFKANTPAVGQFYSVAVDMAKPYRVYGGLQDNGVWVGPSTYKAGYGWYDSGEYPYKRLNGGDGMQVAIDTRDNNLVYTGSQYGYYNRVNQQTGERLPFQPKHELGERPLRWNWESPVLVSKHNQDIIYFGSNKFHRSLNQATDFVTLSGDLTKGGKPGDIAYGTLTTLDESPLKFGLIYAGSDDGLIHVSKDGGYTWTRISDKLPQDLWVSQVSASAFDEGTVYVSLNAYRNDDFTAYVYRSTNYGQTWTRIGTDLPLEPVNVIKEDPKNKNLIYVGTDHGLYASLDQGNSFMRFNGGLPAVAVHDLAIQSREQDLIVATHGRSLYLGSVKELEQLNAEILKKELHVFAIPSINFSNYWGRKMDEGYFEPNVSLPLYSASANKLDLSIKTESGLVLKTLSVETVRGLNYLEYDLSIQDSAIKPYRDELAKAKKGNAVVTESGKLYLQPGKYTVEVQGANGVKFTETLVIAAGGRGQMSFEPDAETEPEEPGETK
ncbi:MAG: WD40/YVTN/BNR-like repeat-containing protein [Sphingobacteriaceae bacterium]